MGGSTLRPAVRLILSELLHVASSNPLARRAKTIIAAGDPDSHRGGGRKAINTYPKVVEQ